MKVTIPVKITFEFSEQKMKYINQKLDDLTKDGCEVTQ